MRVGGKPLAAAVDAIDRRGVLLLYPLANRPDPPSLWGVLHPRAAMRWAWDETGDDRVVELWHLRGRLAEDRRVVYTKWFRGRATFVSRPVFRALLSAVRAARPPEQGLSPEARALLELLEESSPRSTRELRRGAGLEGKLLERAFVRAMSELWSRLLVVGAGEVDDGAFPSLAVGATRLLYEDLYDESARPDRPSRADDEARLARALGASPALRRAFDATMASLGAAPPRPSPPEPARPSTAGRRAPARHSSSGGASAAAPRVTLRKSSR
ncbi:MAG TPA: hypothetical protein VFS43_37565 [Polyangiaceae bacterium]|nr:hypothetical protein [Polyangiaceae bacterium]